MVSTKHLEVEQQISLQGHDWHVSCLDFSPNGLYLASGSWDKTIRIWDLSVLETSIVIGNGENGHTAPITSISWLPDIEFLLVSSSSDCTSAIWNMDSGAKLATFSHHYGWVLGTSISPKESTLCTASWDKTLNIVDLKSLEVVSRLHGHSEGVWDCDFAKNTTDLLCSSSEDGSVKVWDTRVDNKWSTAKTLIGAHEDGIRCCAWSPCGSYIAAGSCDSKVSIWDIRCDKLINFMEGHEDTVSDLVLFEKPGSSLFLASVGDVSCRLWYPLSRSNIELSRFAYHDDGLEVECLAISPDTSLLATGGRDNKIMLSTLLTDSFEDNSQPIIEASNDRVNKLSTTSMTGSSAAIVDHAVLRSDLLERQRSAMAAKQTIKIKVKPTSELLQSKLMQLRPNTSIAEEPVSPTTAADRVKDQISQLRKVELSRVISSRDETSTQIKSTSEELVTRKKSLRSISHEESPPVLQKFSTIEEAEGSMRYKSKELLMERTRLRHVDVDNALKQDSQAVPSNGIPYGRSSSSGRSSSTSSSLTDNHDVFEDSLNREMDGVAQDLLTLSQQNRRSSAPNREFPKINNWSNDAKL